MGLNNLIDGRFLVAVIFGLVATLSSLLISLVGAYVVVVSVAIFEGTLGLYEPILPEWLT